MTNNNNNDLNESVTKLKESLNNINKNIEHMENQYLQTSNRTTDKFHDNCLTCIEKDSKIFNLIIIIKLLLFFLGLNCFLTFFLAKKTVKKNQRIF